MKKIDIRIILVAVVAGMIGFCMNQIMHIGDDQLIDKQNEALEQAEKVMWNNDLPDKDGSDDMELYLELCREVSALYESKI